MVTPRKPAEQIFMGGQEESIRLMIHGLEHGSVKGTRPHGLRCRCSAARAT
jgi:hypothetical protein